MAVSTFSNTAVFSAAQPAKAESSTFSMLSGRVMLFSAAQAAKVRWGREVMVWGRVASVRREQPAKTDSPMSAR